MTLMLQIQDNIIDIIAGKLSRLLIRKKPKAFYPKIIIPKWTKVRVGRLSRLLIKEIPKTFYPKILIPKWTKVRRGRLEDLRENYTHTLV